MSRDLASMLADEPVPHPAINAAIKATPYQWRDPASIPVRSWVYGHMLLRGSLTVVVAPGATGKTALTIGTAMALATGRNLLGPKVWGGPKRVWLWNLEDAGEEMARGLQAAAIHWRIEPDDVGDRLYVDSGMDGAELKTAHETKDGTRINAPVVGALLTQLREQQIDVLIVDPFVSSHSVNENDNRAIDLVAKQWARLASQAGCAVILVHHARKLAGGEVSAEAARGASALIAAARSVPTLNRMSDDEATKFGIEGEERRRFFRVYDDKNNRAPPSDKSDWYRLHSVSLGNGPDGGDSLPVVVPWSPPDAFDGVTVDCLRRVQSALSDGTYRQDHQSKRWAGEAVADVLGMNIEKAGDKARIKTLLSTWIRNGALAVVMKPDERRKEKAFLVVGEWVDQEPAPPRKGGAEQGGAVPH